MRRRPILKLKRSYFTMVIGIMFSLASTLVYYVWLNEQKHGTLHVFLEPLHATLWWAGIFMMMTVTPLFVLTIVLGPGHLKPFYDFT